MEEPVSTAIPESVPDPMPVPDSAPAAPDRSWVVWLVILPVIFALGLGAGYVLWGRNSASTQGTSAAIQVPENVTRYDIPTDGDPSIGPDDAKITIVEFSDYQCPYCKRWHDDVFDRLLQAYPDEVRIVYRDFPLTSIHPQAFPAAEAADCAGEQGAYWDYNRALFSQKYGLDQTAYHKYASELGLDTTAFGQCLRDNRFSDEVNGDLNYAADLGISSTPTFFINGIALVGAQPYDVFKQLIDLELAGKIPQN
jgi:protein-disulfide isomerase